jgi:hypothetical protein
MLNIEVNCSAEGMGRYFDRELAVSDYLMKDPDVWAGLGAERLGLDGQVQRRQFVALLRNEDPTSASPERADSSPRYRSLMTFRVTGQRRSTSSAL